MLHQSGPRRIFEDVCRRAGQVVCISHNMIVKPFLPDVVKPKRAQHNRRLAFESPNRKGQRRIGIHGSQKKMAVVRHEAVSMDIEEMLPRLLFEAANHRFDNTSNSEDTPPVLRANGHEVCAEAEIV
jgi:hypothetical protein